jgi:hypothetical protein
LSASSLANGGLIPEKIAYELSAMGMSFQLLAVSYQQKGATPIASVRYEMVSRPGRPDYP